MCARRKILHYFVVFAYFVAGILIAGVVEEKIGKEEFMHAKRDAATGSAPCKNNAHNKCFADRGLVG